MLKIWTKSAPYIAGLAVVLIFVLLGTLVWQVHQNQQTLNEHTNTLSEVKQLRNEVTALVATAGPAITKGQNELIGNQVLGLAKLTWIECAITAVDGGMHTSSCGPRP